MKHVVYKYLPHISLNITTNVLRIQILAVTLQCPVLLAILWKPGFRSCELTLSPSKLEIMTNSSQGIPSGEPLGMSMCCGQPHPQKLNSSRAVPPPGRFNCRLRNVLSNGIVSVESVDFRSMMFDLGFTAAHQCGTSLYNNITSVKRFTSITYLCFQLHGQ